MQNLVTFLDTVTKSAAQANSQVAEVVASSQGLQQAQAMANRASTAVRAASSQVRENVAATQQAAGEVEGVVNRLLDGRTDLAKLIDLLKQFSGSQSASKAALETIQLVLSGAITAQQALESIGGTMVEFEGQSQSLFALFGQLLPKAGEVRAEIGELLAEVRGQQNEVQVLLGQLEGDISQTSQAVLGLFNKIREGRADLNDLQKLLAKIRQEGLDGSLGDLVGQRLEQLLRDGQLDGGF